MGVEEVISSGLKMVNFRKIAIKLELLEPQQANICLNADGIYDLDVPHPQSLDKIFS